MKVYVCQYDIAWEDRAANHERVREMLTETRLEEGALVVLPEMFDTGFSMNVGLTAGEEAEKSLVFLESLAKDLGVWLLAGVVTGVEGDEGKGRNQAVMISPYDGEVARYTKIHLFSYTGEDKYYVADNEVVVTQWADMKVCPTICYDVRFAELYRAGVKRGAEMFVVIANFPAARCEHWRALLVARAIENQCYVVGVNRVGRDPNIVYAGGSMVVGPDGKVIVEAGDKAGVYEAGVDGEMVREYRREFPAIRDMREDLF